MAYQKENYSQNQLDLIKDGTTEYSNWNSGFGDYIRLSVHESITDRFIDRFYSNRNTEDGIPQITEYTFGAGSISVKPNEILEANYVASGDYDLQFDFLRNIFSSVDLNGEQCDEPNVPDGCNENYGNNYFTFLNPKFI